jgi:hypothetical protein
MEIEVKLTPTDEVPTLNNRNFMIPVGLSEGLSEEEKALREMKMTREALGKFERSKILEIYFARLDGRVPDEIPSEHEELYALELADIKNFLLGQHPQDPILQKIFRIMS